MGILSLIIKREFTAKVRNKSFIVMTFLSPLLFVGLAAFVGYLTTIKADIRKIAVHDQTGMFRGHFESDDEYLFIEKPAEPIEALIDSVASEKFEGLLHIPDVADYRELSSQIRYISNDSPGMAFIAHLEESIESKLTQYNYQQAKLDTQAIREAQSRVNIALAKSSGEESLKGLNEIKIAIGGIFGYLIMMFIIVYGNMVMRSVIEEKTNRIVEIIISSVRPFQLMMGKIIGTSLAGLLQFIIWGVIGFGLFTAASVFFGVDMGGTSQQMSQAAQNSGLVELYIRELWELPIASIAISFVVYFVGGYFLYSSFYAAIGAAVDNETDSQQFLLPIIMPLILGVYIGFFTVINDPHGTIATVFSMIPLTSPIVMLMRIPFGVPWWQILLSVMLLFATFLLVVWVSAKIYRVGILMYGKKPSYKELFRWLKY